MATRFPNTLRSSQRHRTAATEGRLPGDPSAYRRDQPYACKEERLSPTTVARQRINPNPLAKRFTKFTTNYTGQVKIPTNLMHPDREVREFRAFLDVGDIPEE